MSNRSTYMISVGVMGYNQENYVRQTMDCILAQKCSYPFEIVIGDDASTDTTRAILEEYQQQHPGMIRLLPKAPNKGVLRNYADVVKACAGKYIAFCHCDDYWHDPLKLQKQVDFLENNPGYGLIHTDADFYLENTGSTLHSYHGKVHPNMPEGEVFESLLQGKFSIVTPTALYTKEAMDKFVDFDEFEKAGFLYEDLPTWLALSRHVKVKFLKDSTSTYRVIDNSHSHPKSGERKLFLLQGHYNMKMHFIKKYQVATDVQRKFEIQYNHIKFTLAYKWGKYTEGLEAFKYLKAQDSVNLKMRLKLLFLQLPFLRKALKNIKRLYLPKTSLSRL
jgi:glycosyltransferase involved in cell wall biosynthesis